MWCKENSPALLQECSSKQHADVRWASKHTVTPSVISSRSTATARCVSVHLKSGTPMAKSHFSQGFFVFVLLCFYFLTFLLLVFVFFCLFFFVCLFVCFVFFVFLLAWSSVTDLLQRQPCQAPGSKGSALTLAGSVSVYWDWVRQKA